MKVFKTIISLGNSEEPLNLQDWRDRFGDIMVVLFLVGLPLAMIITFPTFWADRNYSLIIIDITVWVLLIFRSFKRPEHSYLNNILWLFILYAMAISFFYALGPNYARSAWLVFCAVMAALLFGPRTAAGATCFNAVFLISLYIIKDNNDPVWVETFRKGSLHYAMFIINSSLVTLGACLPVGFLINRLEKSLTMEKQTRRALEEESLRLNKTNERLLEESLERQNATKALRENEERLRLLTDNLPNAMMYQIVVNPDGTRYFTYVSSNVDRLNEVDRESVLADANTLYDMVLPEYRDRLLENEIKALDDRTPFNYEIKCRLPSGMTKWFELSSTPKKYDDGSIVWDGVQLDVTERKKVEEELRLSEERYRLVIDNANEAIIITQDGLIKFFNNQASKLSGYSIEEAVDAPIIDFIHPEDRDQVIENHMKRIKGKTVSPVYRFRCLTKEGQTVWVDHYAVLVDWQGKPAVLAFMTDITKLVLSEKDRLKYEAHIRHAQKMEAIGTLAGGIAHDFNNILTAIQGYVELLLRKIPPETKERDHLLQVKQAGKRAGDLVEQILTFCRQAEQELKPVQISIIVKEAVKLLRATLPSNIDIRLNLDTDALILGDPTQIHQIIMNLCTNAWHAMEPGGGIISVDMNRVVLDAVDAPIRENIAPGPYISLEISDTGSGMTNDVMERIFDPFYTTKNRGEGTGMGLAVVHGIVKSHKGQIFAYSEPGTGSTFKVYLPIIERTADAESVEAIPPQTGTGSILLVDDEEVIVELVREMLVILGYEVTTETNSRKALEIFRNSNGSFDLVITDMTMPDLTGDLLAVELLKIQPDIPIVMSTGYSLRVPEDRIKEIGIRTILKKPISITSLAETVATHIRKKTI